MANKIKNLAKVVDKAALKAEAIEQLSLSKSFTEEEAYAIQKASIDRRYDRGEKYIGLKMGFTSRLKMQQMGVHDMIWGRLTDAMLLEEGGELDLEKYIHPRAEPELCFLIKKKIKKTLNLTEAVNYIEAISGAIEIIDSRYKNFKFSLEDVIADNCSSAGLILGRWQKPNINIDNLGMVLEFNQRPVQIGSSAAILGNPLRSLVAASRLAMQYEQEIPAGSIILAGAATPAVYLKKGDHVQARIESMGRIGITVI